MIYIFKRLSSITPRQRRRGLLKYLGDSNSFNRDSAHLLIPKISRETNPLVAAQAAPPSCLWNHLYLQRYIADNFPSEGHPPRPQGTGLSGNFGNMMGNAYCCGSWYSWHVTTLHTGTQSLKKWALSLFLFLTCSEGKVWRGPRSGAMNRIGCAICWKRALFSCQAKDGC